MIKMVIFDFDGTIADTEKWSLDIYNTLAKKYGYRTYTLEEFEEIKKHPIPKIITMLDIPYRKIFTLLKEGQKILKKNINSVEPFNDNIKNILDAIKKQTGTIGFISSNTKKNIRRFCKNKKISVDFIRSSPLFTKEIMIQSIMRNYKVKPHEVIYVGDEVRDIESSKKAGVYMAAATWGYNSRELLSQAKPDFLIDDISELLNIIQCL